MSDIDTGTANEQPADDIRSTLAQAVMESEAPEPAESDVGNADPSNDGRARGADGKFVKKEAGDEPDPSVAAAVAEAPVEDPALQQQPADSKEPPANWSEADKALFKSQPPQAQEFLLSRHKAMEADYTKKTQAIASFKNEYEPVAKMFEPHAATLRAKGFTPRSLIEAWANVETKLASGPDSAVDVIKGLVSGYGISTEKLAAALGLSGTAPAQQAQQQPTAIENGQPVQLPPEVAAELKQLREQVGSVTSWKQTQEQRDAEAARVRQFQAEQDAENQATQFKSAKDDKGNPLHPYADEVEGAMLRLAQGYVASKQPVPSLKELYDEAVYAHPATREKVLTASRQAEEAKRLAEARTKAAAARKAGSSVNGAPGSGQAPTSGKSEGLSLREQLEEATNDAA